MRKIEKLPCLCYLRAIANMTTKQNIFADFLLDDLDSQNKNSETSNQFCQFTSRQTWVL